MNRILPILLVFFGAEIAFSQSNPELPTAAKQLVEGLERWEAVQREDLEQRIVRKKAEILNELKRHLDAATRGGNLDGAIAIREKIAELEPQKLPASRAELSAWLEGRKIEFSSPRSGRHVIEFNRDSAVLYLERNSGRTISYRALSDRAVELKWDTTYKLEYSDDMTEATFVSPAGEYPVKTGPKGQQSTP